MEVLGDLHDFYWNSVRKTVSEMKDMYVLIPNLGTFAIKGDLTLSKEIGKLMPILHRYEANPPNTPVKCARWYALKAKIEKLTNLRDRYIENSISKHKIRRLRSEIRKDKEALQRPAQDCGGDLQSGLSQEGG